MLWSRILLDFTVWDNDGAYALVTFTSIAFAIVVIVVVARQSRTHDRADPPLETPAALPESAGETNPPA